MTRMLMCGHKLCEEDGYNQFENLMLGEEFLPGQIGVLYKAGMIRGDMSTFQNVIRVMPGNAYNIENKKSTYNSCP